MAKLRVNYAFLVVFLVWNSAFVFVALLNLSDYYEPAKARSGEKWPEIHIEPDAVSVKNYHMTNVATTYRM